MENRSSYDDRVYPAWIAALVVLCALLWRPSSGAAASAREERDACARNLKAIHEAVQSYRRANQELPNWLSDLVPDHLDEANQLICPVTRRTGEIKNYGLSDPKVSTSYVYEFCNHPIPNAIRSDSSLTMQEWKQLQMALVGSIVPMLRCHHHDPVLNLSYGGQVFESPDAWESEISGLVKADHLSPEYLQAKFGGSGAARFVTIDLEPFHNCSLTETLHAATGTEPGPNLAMLPDGMRELGGVAFDIRGVIHLQGRQLKNITQNRYPEAVKDIPIDVKTTRLHFLVGAGWPSADNVEVARFTVHYADGETAVIPVRYNQEIRDWMHGTTGGENAPRPAWSGDINPSPNEDQVVYLHRISWDNPRPDVVVESVDLESTMEDTAPFVLAISTRKL